MNYPPVVFRSETVQEISCIKSVKIFMPSPLYYLMDKHPVLG